MTESSASPLTPEEEEVFKQQIESCNANIARFEREVRAATARFKAEVTMRDSLLAKLGSAVLATGEGGAVTGVSHKTSPGTMSSGLSETIRMVMRENSKSMRPPAVAMELKKRQFPYSATTPLVTRVGNEMRRMQRAGMLTRHGSKYALVAESASGQTKAVNGAVTN